MEDLIKQAFTHVEVIGQHVQEGHYDLIGPDGEIILPVVWDKTIQPGWQISMRMWPGTDKPPMPGPHPGQPMTAEQFRAHMMRQQAHRQAQAAAHGHGHGHGHGGGRVPPMRPPGFTGGMPFGGNPPPPPGMGPLRPPGGEGGRPAMVDIIDGGRPSKKDKGKKAKKTLGFFSGTKPSKKRESSKKFVYIDPVGYPIYTDGPGGRHS